MTFRKKYVKIIADLIAGIFFFLYQRYVEGISRNYALFLVFFFSLYLSGVRRI